MSIMMGAKIEPNEAAAPNKPCANARSFCGNHSALLLVVPGHGPASPNPSIIRNVVNERMPRDSDVMASAAPHNNTETKNPFLVPILSYIFPDTNWLIP